jgi:hypothetical protein
MIEPRPVRTTVMSHSWTPLAARKPSPARTVPQLLSTRQRATSFAPTIVIVSGQREPSKRSGAAGGSFETGTGMPKGRRGRC